MQSEKVTKIKRQIARLSFEEVSELNKYTQKTKDKKSREKYRVAKLKEYNRLRSLESGTKVIVTEGRSDLSGRIGVIERHLTGKSQRTVVKFDDNLCWRIPTLWLSDDVSEGHLERIKQNRGLTRAFNKIISEVTA